MSKAVHFVSKNIFPENWILGAKGITGLFFTIDGVIHVGNVPVIFLYQELIKSGSSSMLVGRMHVTTVEMRMDRTEEGHTLW